MSEIKELTKDEIINTFLNFEKLLNQENNLPDIKNKSNTVLVGYLFDLIESEKYELHLSEKYEEWKQLVISECLDRGIVELNK